MKLYTFDRHISCMLFCDGKKEYIFPQQVQQSYFLGVWYWYSFWLWSAIVAE